MKSNITTCIGTYNSLEFLKLTIDSIRCNEYFQSPLIVFADGCTDGTNEWLVDNKEKYNITTIIEPSCDDSSNGYGMNVCASHVKTEFINFVHADMYCAKNFDLALYNRMQTHTDDRWLISSYRIQPNIFHNGMEPDRPGTLMVDPDAYGDCPENFNRELFDCSVEEFVNVYSGLTMPKAEGCSFLIRKEDWASDQAVEGEWKWVDGPESGEIFWNGNASGSAPVGQYANIIVTGKPKIGRAHV